MKIVGSLIYVIIFLIMIIMINKLIYKRIKYAIKNNESIKSLFFSMNDGKYKLHIGWWFTFSVTCTIILLVHLFELVGYLQECFVW